MSLTRVMEADSPSIVRTIAMQALALRILVYVVETFAEAISPIHNPLRVGPI